MTELSNSVLQRLAATQTHTGHLEPDLLCGFAEGTLREAEREHVMGHLAACPDCREALALAAVPPRVGEVQSVRVPGSAGRRFLGWQALVTAAVACLLVASAVMLRMAPRRGEFSIPVTQPADQNKIQIATGLGQPAARPSAIQSDQISAPPKAALTARTMAAATQPPRPPLAITAPSSPVATNGAIDRNSSTVEVTAQAPAMENSSAPSANGSTVGRLSADKFGAQQPAAALRAQAAPSPTPPPQSAPAANSAESSAAMIVADGEARKRAQQNVTAGRAGGMLGGVQAAEANRNATANKQDTTANQKESSTVNQPEPRQFEVETKSSGPEYGANSGGVVATIPKSRRALAKLPAVARWIISAEGKLQRSLDAGRNWETVSVGEPVVFRAADAAGASVWAGGDSAVLYRSLDAGDHWSRVIPAAGSRNLTGDVVSVRTAGEGGRVVRVRTSTGQNWISNDQGAHWQLEQ